MYSHYACIRNGLLSMLYFPLEKQPYFSRAAALFLASRRAICREPQGELTNGEGLA